MKTGMFTHSTVFALALAGASLFACAPAMAHQSGKAARQSDPPQEQITVSGPQIARSHFGSSAQLETGGFGYNVLSFTHRVSYADLDLASPADVFALKERIGDAAKQVCRRLETMTPPESSTSSQCLHDAVKGALKQVRAAAAAAKD